MYTFFQHYLQWLIKLSEAKTIYILNVAFTYGYINVVIFLEFLFVKKKNLETSLFLYSHLKKKTTSKNPRNTCGAVIYPRFLRNHQALSMLPLLHPWRFLGQQEIKFWGERLAVYRPLDWIAIRSAATPVSNKILINIQIICDIIFLILFYLNLN